MMWEDNTQRRLLHLELRAERLEHSITHIEERIDDLIILLLEIQAGLRSIAADDRASKG
jgi:hypothetical protein